MQRWSGVVLALFLPFHMLVLSLSLQNSQAFDDFLYWADNPMVKFAEAGLVALLTIHLLGGLRILFIEFFAWSEWQGTMISFSAAAALFTSCLFLMGAF